MQTVEKWASRSDAWTSEDDTRLAELVLSHIRSGSTQLKAFEEAASLLGRTPAACGYRWNGVVRKEYHTDIDVAKKSRKQAHHDELASHEQTTVHSALTATSDSIQEVITFLQSYDERYHKLRAYLSQVEEEKESLASHVKALQQELQSRTSGHQPVNSKQLEEDSRTLVAIMERARKLLGDSGSRTHPTES